MVAKTLVLALLAAPAAALAPAPKAKPTLKVQAKAAAKQAAAAALGAALLIPTPALAARSGGRAGGGGMRGGGMRGGGYSRSYSAAPRMRTQTRMYASPMVMPMPMMSPFGMGMGYGYGGISPGAVVGLTVLDAIADEQRRQAYLRSQLETQRQLGKDQASIDQLTAMIDAQDKRIAELQAQVQGAQK
jgi:uncharacterized membrane protein